MAIGLDDDETPFGLGDDYGADISEAEADALEELIARGAELSGLSEDELTRELEKLVPVHGAPLLLEDGLEALGQAWKALEDRDYLDALAAAADGAIELSGLAFGAGTLVKGARLVGKIGARRALDILASLARHGRGPGRDGRLPPANPAARLPEGSVAPLRTTSGAQARVAVAGQRRADVERLDTAIGHVTAADARSVTGLIDGGRLDIATDAGENVVNIQKSGGAAAADAAFERIVKEHGGSLDDVVPNPRGVRTFTTKDGTTYSRYESSGDNGQTVSVIIVAPGANRNNRFDLKVRFDNAEVSR